MKNTIVVTLSIFFVIGFALLVLPKQVSSKPETPPTQAAFLHLLEDYRKQYSLVDPNNAIQMNRIYDARTKALCDIDPDVRDWIGVVYKVRTTLFNSRHKASLDIALPSSFNDKVGFSGETINLKEDSELFETIANLKRGDKVRISGALDRYKGCVHEHSVTQTFGMEWPAFWFTYSEVNGVRSNKLSLGAR